MKALAASVPDPRDLQNRDSVSAQGLETRCLDAVRLMYGFWRKSDAFDPTIFAAGAAAVLSEYPIWVVDLVTDPRTGLPSRLQFPPTVKEIRDACDTLMEERAILDRRNMALKKQFADRVEYERLQAERKNHPSQAELEQKLGRPLGKPALPAPPAQLWGAWCRHRIELPGIKLDAQSREILEAAGYDIDGPDDQLPPQAENTGGEPCPNTEPEQSDSPSA